MAPALANSIIKGAEMALEHCQTVFKWDKWNCPTSSFLRYLSFHLQNSTFFIENLFKATEAGT